MTRVLYLINHTSLVEFECNLIKDLGFEIYLPKTTGSIRSCTVNYEFDKTLTLSSSVIDTLNGSDFYSENLSKEIIRIINKYFDIVIVPNIYPVLFNVVKNFKGYIILRAFGYEKDINYEQTTTVTQEIHGYRKFFKPHEIIYYNEMTRALYKCRNRFILGVSYKEIIDNETPFFKKHCAYLPLGSGKSVWNLENAWDKKENVVSKIMFVCPSIESSYYGEIYKNFKTNFGDIPHSIFGKNKIPNEDKTIVGFLERSEFDKALMTYKLMFYHSQEKRHLHYHPLEAIIIGQPLIFMSGGLLEKFSKGRCVGMAYTVEDARRKIQRILNDDKDFISEVKQTQKIILEEFKYDYVKSVWESFLMEKKIK